jgi:DNA-binding winged helix-turn-helix (wHTH) protein/TolB-like protein/Flp pilus assembly protein TadD
MSPSHARYEFGEFILDAGQRRLLRRDTGALVPLTGKAFETLLCLVEHAGETLGKDRLLQAIWPGVIVEENSLTQNISTLRQALGETRGENRYIATVSRTGYRFVAGVKRLDAIEPPAAGSSDPVPGLAPARTASAVAAVLLAVVFTAILAWVLRAGEPSTPPVATVQSLAILPFKPLLPAERNESLELGMAESLISIMGQHSEQAISPLSSVRRYTALDQDAIAAGRALGVDNVLDGSLQRSGDRLRVTARLVRVSDGQQLWTHSFDEDFTGIFDVQDDIAARLAQALSVRWPESGATRGAPYTRDPEAYALYASGRLAWTRQTEPSLLHAIEYFEQAIARDPGYALAYSGLADSLAVLGVFGIRDPREVFPGARRAAERALSIDPDLAAAHSALGHILVQYEHDGDGAAREYERSISLDPSLALTHHRRALLQAMQGDFDGALESSALAQQLEPLWIGPRVAEGCFLYYARRHQDSIRLLEQVLALDDRAANARSCLIRNLIVTGDHDRALSEIDRQPIQAPGSNALRAQALTLAGKREEALAELERVMRRSKAHYVAAYDIALIHAALADTENAFHWLDRAMDDRSTLLVFLAQEPMFDALRADSRFAALVGRIGIYRRPLSGTAMVHASANAE